MTNTVKMNMYLSPYCASDIATYAAMDMERLSNAAILRPVSDTSYAKTGWIFIGTVDVTMCPVIPEVMFQGAVDSLKASIVNEAFESQQKIKNFKDTLSKLLCLEAPVVCNVDGSFLDGVPF
jgi:hypothetical protein